MSDSTRPYTSPPVRVVFRPYDHDAVRSLLNKVSQEFGRPGKRYKFISPANVGWADAWCLDFHFTDPHDAIIFALKYQKG